VGKHGSMFLLVFVTIAFFIIPGTSRNGLAASFSADMVTTEKGKSETGKFYMLDHQYRMDVEEDGMKGTILVDRTGGKTRLLIHDKKEYKEMNNNDFFVLISNPFEAYEMMLGKFESRSGGSEKIDGIECDKVILSSEGKDAVTAWVAKPYAFLIRLENHRNGNTYALKNIKEGPMDEAEFQIPAGYSKMEDPAEKRAREEAALPFLTTTATGTAPWARRIGPSGEMRVAVDPEKKVRIKFENFTEDKSVFSVKGFRAGQPIDLDSQRTIFSLRGKGRRDECLVGAQNQAEEISVSVEKGRIIAEVFNEEFSFSNEDKTTSFFIVTGIRDRAEGTYVDAKRHVRLSITSDSQDGTASKVKVTVYKDEDYKDKVDETDVVLKNGQSKTWDYPAEMGIRYLGIDVAKGGGAQVILEQPAPEKKAAAKKPAVTKAPQPKVTDVFTVTHPSGTSKPLNPSKDLAIIVTGISSDASGTIYLYPDRNQTKKIDTFSFKLKKDEAEALFVPGSKQAGWASVWVHKGSFKVKLDQSAHANVAPAPKVRKDTAAPPPSVKAEQTASSGTILNGEAPLMKGARVIKEMAMGANSRVDFEVPASPQEVVDFYKQAMAAKGWQPGMSIVQGPMGVIQLSKGASQITLKAQGDGQKCAVNIALMTR
jgi:hypothetical protein